MPCNGFSQRCLVLACAAFETFADAQSRFLRLLDMLDDNLPDLQFSPSVSSGKEQCSTKQDCLPTASFASQRKACRTSPGLRKGFLTGASAKSNKKVRPP